MKAPLTEDVHPSKTRPYLVEQGVDLVFAAHVALHRQAALFASPTAALIISTVSASPASIDVNQHRRRSAACEPDTDPLADAAAGAGDHCDPVLEREQGKGLRVLDKYFWVTRRGGQRTSLTGPYQGVP